MNINHRIFSIREGELQISLTPKRDWSKVDLIFEYPKGERKFEEINLSEAAEIISPYSVKGTQGKVVYNESKDNGGESFDLSFLDDEQIFEDIKPEEFLRNYNRPEMSYENLDNYREFESRIAEGLKREEDEKDISSRNIGVYGWINGVLTDRNQSYFIDNEETHSSAELVLENSDLRRDELSGYEGGELEIYGVIDAEFEEGKTVGRFQLKNPKVYFKNEKIE